MNCLPRLMLVVLVLSVCTSPVNGHEPEDPHRPGCISARCKAIKSYLKIHYCGDAPFGNGPDDGCDIRDLPKPKKDVKVLADFSCEQNETTQESTCKQSGEPSSGIRRVLVQEMHRAGLPLKDENATHFIVWKSISADWTFAEALHEKKSGEADLTVSQIILVIGRDAKVSVIRKVQYQKTDADVPTVTTWSPVDLADVDGDGEIDVVLRGDSYENHWLEVESVKNGFAHKIFAGLGYYL